MTRMSTVASTAATPRRGTRGRILRAAMDLFYERGFNAVGLDQILAAAGVTKTTFYNHFESKDHLIEVGLTLRDEPGVRQWFQEVRAAADGDPRRMLLGFFASLEKWFADERFHGCIFTNAAIEFPHPADPIHQIGGAHKHRIETMFAQVARAAHAREPEELARQLMIVIEGALVWHHVARRPAVDRSALQIARVLIENATADADR